MVLLDWRRRILSASAEDRNSCQRKHPAEILALAPSCAFHRRSSNANSLCGRNSAGSLEICATFQRDILLRRFCGLRRLSHVPVAVLALAPTDLLIERDRGQFVPFRRRANVRAERLLKIPAEPSPELRIPGAAAQTRMVSVAKIRLDRRKSTRLFKGIICDDIS